MNGYSILIGLLRPRTDEAPQQSVLLPRTAADELPPYREQPWSIDRQGYRRVYSMTTVPADKW